MTALIAAVTVVGIANLRRPRVMGQGVLALRGTLPHALLPPRRSVACFFLVAPVQSCVPRSLPSSSMG